MLLAVCAVCAVCAGCVRTPPSPDTLRLAVSSPPEALDPRFATSAVATRLAALVAAPLVSIGDDLRPQPCLAAALAHPDPLTFVVTLRPDARFADGAAVSAADVRFTLLSMKDPAVASPHAAKLAHVKDVVVVDDRTARIELDAPYPALPVDLNAYGILEEKACAGARDSCRFTPMGAGPYRVERPLDGDERLVLVANEGWPGGPPRIRRIEVSVVRDGITRLFDLEDRRIDLVVGDLLPTDVRALAGRGDVEVERAPGLGFSYLAFNVRGPRPGDSPEAERTRRALADPRVRRALGLALDVDAVIRAKLDGRARRASGMLPDGHWAKDGDERPLPFDPARAGALLDAAGFPERPSGGRFRVTLSTTTDRLRRAIALVLADQWRAVGVDVEVVVRDWSALYEDVQKGAFDAFSAKWVPVLEPDLMHWVYASSSIPRPGRAGGNRSGYADAALDGWLDAAETTDDEAARRDLYVEAQRRVARDLPLLPLWFEDEVAAHTTRLRGFRLGPTASLLPLARASLAESAR